jgi:hypothetical protein
LSSFLHARGWFACRERILCQVLIRQFYNTGVIIDWLKGHGISEQCVNVVSIALLEGCSFAWHIFGDLKLEQEVAEPRVIIKEVLDDLQPILRAAHHHDCPFLAVIEEMWGGEE